MENYHAKRKSRPNNRQYHLDRARRKSIIRDLEKEEEDIIGEKREITEREYDEQMFNQVNVARKMVNQIESDIQDMIIRHRQKDMQKESGDCRLSFFETNKQIGYKTAPRRVGFH